MSQKSEDSIERFFRKGLVQQDKTFMERDWERMEKMLDDRAMTAASTRAARVRTATRVGIMVTLMSFLVLIGVEKEHWQSAVQMQAAVGAVGPRIKVKAQKPAADLHSSVKDNGVATRADKPPTMRVKARKKLSTPARPATRKSFVVPNSINLVGHNNTNDGPGVSSLEGARARVESSGNLPQTDVEDQTNQTSAQQLQSDIVNEGEKLSEELPGIPQDVPSAALQTEEKRESSVRKNSMLSVTALISPDFSTTSLSRYSKPTGVFGLLLGFRISKHFTLMAGATKSLKRYEGYGGEYSPPEGYWENRTNGIIPDEVKGQCGIVEVPIIVQFDVRHRSKSRIFLAGGVSSYFMRSERYDYTFYELNPGAANNWTAKEPTDYLFKIGHLSAGYDHMIGKKFVLGIEPFLKVPFEGIGWTDINLYSTGAYINLRYNILSIHQD